MKEDDKYMLDYRIDELEKKLCEEDSSEYGIDYKI